MNWNENQKEEFRQLAIQRYPKNFKENPVFANWVLLRVHQILENKAGPKTGMDWDSFEEFCNGEVNSYLLFNQNKNHATA